MIRTMVYLSQLLDDIFHGLPDRVLTESAAEKFRIRLQKLMEELQASAGESEQEDRPRVRALLSERASRKANEVDGSLLRWPEDRRIG